MSNYPLRLPDHVMTEAKALAEINGASLNQFLTALIAERIGELKAMAQFEARAARGDAQAARVVLERAPARAPMPGDEL